MGACRQEAGYERGEPEGGRSGPRDRGGLCKREQSARLERRGSAVGASAVRGVSASKGAGISIVDRSVSAGVVAAAQAEERSDLSGVGVRTKINK